MSLPRYEKYKDSGVEWLESIPAHWEIKCLKYVCDIMPSNVDKKSHDDEPCISLCNYTDVYYRDQITGEISFMVATASADQIRRFTLRSGDVLITKDSETADDIGIAAYVPHDLPGVVCGYHLSVIRTRGDMNGLFVKRLFDSHYVRARLNIAANGLTRVGLSQYAVDNLDVPVPSPAEQAAIATFLDHETTKIDALIAEQQRLIELLREKRQAVISHAVTKGLNPAAPMKPSGIEWLGDIPAHWSHVRLGWLFKQQKRQGFEDKEVLSVYREFGVIRKNSRTDNFNKTPEDLSSYQLLEPGDLVVNKMKAWQGSLGVSDLEGITSPDYMVFTPNHDHSPTFLHFLLRAEVVVSYYIAISNGIRLAQWRLEPDAFLALRIFLPPHDEQLTIAQFINRTVAATDALTTEAQSAITLLQERRTALISAAVTGKIDVRQISAIQR